MAAVEWDESYSVQIEEIDDQHKRLVGMLSDLSEGLEAGKGSEVLGPILSGLIDYTKYHFGTEEKYFAEFGYEGAAEHTRQHQAFVDKVTTFQEQFAQGKALISVQILLFLTEWVMDHIKGSDKDYVACFHANGVR